MPVAQIATDCRQFGSDHVPISPSWMRTTARYIKPSSPVALCVISVHYPHSSSQWNIASPLLSVSTTSAVYVRFVNGSTRKSFSSCIVLAPTTSRLHLTVFWQVCQVYLGATPVFSLEWLQSAATWLVVSLLYYDHVTLGLEFSCTGFQSLPEFISSCCLMLPDADDVRLLTLQNSVKSVCTRPLGCRSRFAYAYTRLPITLHAFEWNSENTVSRT